MPILCARVHYSSHMAQNEADKSWLHKFQKEDEGEAIKRAIQDPPAIRSVADNFQSQGVNEEF